MVINEGFCFRLRQMRERKRVKRSVMSQLCGLNENAVKRFERGERIPNAAALEAMADYLDTTMDYLWNGNGRN